MGTEARPSSTKLKRLRLAKFGLFKDITRLHVLFFFALSHKPDACFSIGSAKSRTLDAATLDAVWRRTVGVAKLVRSRSN